MSARTICSGEQIIEIVETSTISRATYEIIGPWAPTPTFLPSLTRGGGQRAAAPTVGHICRRWTLAESI